MNISRRKFIHTGTLASASTFLPGSLAALGKTGQKSDRVLILLTLSGGNDSLNTVVPYRNPLYYKARPHLSIPSQKILKLNDELGLHPALEGLRHLYGKGWLGIFNRVGFARPEYSHARASRYWETASDRLHTGWIGRYLELIPGQAAIEADVRMNLALKGESRSGTFLKQGADRPFIEKLKNIAKLICSSSPAGVYHLSLCGFDTHAYQQEQHSALLHQLGSGLNAFMKELERNRRHQSVMILVYSEFGRAITQNAAEGTEHGKAGGVFLISGGLKKPGLLDGVPDLTNFDPKKADDNILDSKIDFRRIYATLLNRWLYANDRTVLKGTFPPLDFI